MYNLNKKQKIIIIILLIILAGGFFYYVYTKDDNILENTLEGDISNQIQKNAVNAENTNEDTNSKIVVHISGAVNKEGIVELEENSRVADAIEKAEGVKEDADMSKVNLAFVLEDGMKVYIPSVNEKSSNEQIELVTKDIGTEEANNVSSTQNKKQAKVNINTATQNELENLPGIGPSTASKILQYRKENGKFNSIDEIKEVSGIGESKYNKIKDLIVVK